MATGFEATGLALAVLPLLVNQLDGYVRGLEKIKSSRRYRLEIRGYRIVLSAQHAILLNTLELFLEDIVDDYDKRQALITDPKGPGWTSPDLQQKVVQKLGRNYGVFFETATGLSELLNSLAKKLGLKDADRLQTDSLPFSQAIKFRMMFSRAVYDDLLAKIDTTNQILKSLADHTMHRPQVRQSHRQKKTLRAYQAARKHARALYNSIVRGHCWKCLSACQHSVHFQLNLASLPSTGTAAHATSIAGHTLILSATQVGFRGRWYEITAEPYIAKLSSPVQANESGICPTNRGRVCFLPPEDNLEASTNRAHGLNLSPIEDLCLSLRAFDRLKTDTGLIGYISDVSDKTNQYNMRLLRDYKSDIHTQSLHEILQTSHSSSSTAQRPDTIELCRRDRLFLAAILASAVLQLQGSWLKQNWSSHDIQFANILTDGYSAIKRPYLSWQVSGPSPICLSCQGDSSPHNNKATSTLLPLAISLIELSLGGPISSLQQRGDDELTQIETTAKILDKVQQESGSSYSDVVKECLYWSQPGGLKFGDEKFDERLFNAVVSPLLRDFCSFEGLSYTE